MNLFEPSMVVLTRLIDVAATRHRVTATNIANANVPNYRAKRVDFEAAFSRALQHGGAPDALEVRAEVVDDETAQVKADGNSVHMEKELSTMQRNALAFSVFSSLLQQKMRLMKQAISGGGR